MVPMHLIYILTNVISVYYVVGYVTNINELNNKSPENPTQTTKLEANETQKFTTDNNCANCKKFSPEQSGNSSHKLYAMDDRSLCHVIVMKDDDIIKYFEMNIAIEAADVAYIALSPVAKPSVDLMNSVFFFGVGVSTNQTVLYQKFVDLVAVKDAYTPNILSANRYVYFNIKISDGTLIFSKPDSTPLLTYEDSHLRAIKYFSFSYWTKAKFLYDCPISKS